MFGKILRTVVPDCPRCGSNYTGRYELIYQNNINTILRMEKLAKQKGERIQVIVDYKMPYANCFCDECGAKWHGNVKKQWVDKDEWEDEHDYTEEIENFDKNIRKRKSKKALKILKGTATFLFGIRFRKEMSKEELEMKKREQELFADCPDEE